MIQHVMHLNETTSHKHLINTDDTTCHVHGSYTISYDTTCNIHGCYTTCHIHGSYTISHPSHTTPLIQPLSHTSHTTPLTPLSYKTSKPWRISTIRWHQQNRSWLNAMTHSSRQTPIHMCAMTHVCHDSCVPWLMCAVTHVCRDSCVPWLMCAVTLMQHNTCLALQRLSFTSTSKNKFWKHRYMKWLKNSSFYVLNCMCAMTHVCRDSNAA